MCNHLSGGIGFLFAHVGEQLHFLSDGLIVLQLSFVINSCDYILQPGFSCIVGLSIIMMTVEDISPPALLYILVAFGLPCISFSSITYPCVKVIS